MSSLHSVMYVCVWAGGGGDGRRLHKAPHVICGSIRKPTRAHTRSAEIAVVMIA